MQRISGRVVSPDGSAIQNAEVIAWQPRGETQTGEWSEFALACAQTDDEGRYLLEFEPPEDRPFGPLMLAARAEGRGMHEEFLTYARKLPQALGPSNIVLGPSATLRGRVVDHKGAPAPELLVRIGPHHSSYHPDPHMTGLAVLVVETNEDGRFETIWANRGVFVPIQILWPDGGSLSEGFSAGQQEEMEIRLPEFGSIEGVVRKGETGEPVPAASIHCTEDRSCGFHHWRHYGKSDEDGRFRIPSVPPSRYLVSASGPRAYGQAANIPVHPGETVSRDITCARGIDLRGRVLLTDGSPAPNVSVSACNSGFAQTSSSATTDGDGGFIFEGLAPGRYDLYLMESGVRAKRTVDCRDGEPSDPVCFRLRTASVEADTVARVVDADGRPVPGAWVGTDQHPILLSAADDGGNHNIPFLAGESGDATPRIVAMSTDMSQMGFAKPVAGSEEEGVSIRLDKSLRHVRSRVVTPQGDPIPGAVVSAHAGHGEAKKSPLWLLHLAAVADEDGFFEIGPVDPTLGYYVSASSPGYVSGMG